jgi:hypothetical protein
MGDRAFAAAAFVARTAAPVPAVACEGKSGLKLPDTASFSCIE